MGWSWQSVPVLGGTGSVQGGSGCHRLLPLRDDKQTNKQQGKIRLRGQMDGRRLRWAFWDACVKFFTEKHKIFWVFKKKYALFAFKLWVSVWVKHHEFSKHHWFSAVKFGLNSEILKHKFGRRVVLWDKKYNILTFFAASLPIVIHANILKFLLFLTFSGSLWISLWLFQAVISSQGPSSAPTSWPRGHS